MRALLIIALAATSLAGCGNPLGIGPRTCNRSIKDNPPALYVDGEVVNGVYETSSWSGEWLEFRGGMHYALEHKLGDSPVWVQPYFSFSVHGIGAGIAIDGTRDDDGGLVSPASGDGFNVVAVDDTILTIANSSCIDYYLRVVAGPALSEVPGGDGAGGNDGAGGGGGEGGGATP